MKVPYLDLRVLDQQLRSELLSRVEKVLIHGRIIDGPEQQEFELAVSRTLGARFAVGVSSGSSAVYLALKASGIEAGDEVITTPFTWIITPNAIASTGATPVFVDIKEDFNIDPTAIRRAITSKTKAIVPVHVAGHMCDMKEITQIAKEYRLKIVEDVAQAFCASLNGSRAGSFSTAAGFSMNPMKILHGYGEAGVVTTDNKRIYEKLRQLRHAGTKIDREKKKINLCNFISLNHKIDTMQAAMLLTSLNRIDEVKARRDEIAEYYDYSLSGLLDIQPTKPSEIHGRYIYLAGCRNRDNLRRFLLEKGIETKVFYSPLACDAKVFQKINQGELPVARRLEKRSISLPLHEKMTMKQAKFVVKSIQNYYRKT